MCKTERNISTCAVTSSDMAAESAWECFLYQLNLLFHFITLNHLQTFVSPMSRNAAKAEGVWNKSGKVIDWHLQEELLLFLNTLRMAWLCLPEAMRNQLQSISDTLIRGFGGKKGHLVPSTSTAVPLLIPVQPATSDGQEALDSAGAKKSQYH